MTLQQKMGDHQTNVPPFFLKGKPDCPSTNINCANALPWQTRLMFHQLIQPHGSQLK
jgi:hypothetical protein